MESFYSIIYFKTNALNDELLSLALFTGGEQGPRMYVSSKRMNLLKFLLAPEVYLSVKRNLNYFQEKIDKYRQDQKELLLFDPYYSKEELERISQETLGTLIYSLPVSVNEWMDEELHEKLVFSLLGEKMIKQKKASRSFMLSWRNTCNLSKFDHFEKNKLLTEVNKEAVIPVKMDLYNDDSKIAVKGIDFSVSERLIYAKLQEVRLLASSLNGFAIYAVYEYPENPEAKDLLLHFKNKMKGIKWMEVEQFLKRF